MEKVNFFIRKVTFHMVCSLWCTVSEIFIAEVGSGNRKTYHIVAQFMGGIYLGGVLVYFSLLAGGS